MPSPHRLISSPHVPPTMLSIDPKCSTHTPTDLLPPSTYMAQQFVPPFVLSPSHPLHPYEYPNSQDSHDSSLYDSVCLSKIPSTVLNHIYPSPPSLYPSPPPPSSPGHSPLQEPAHERLVKGHDNCYTTSSHPPHYDDDCGGVVMDDVESSTTKQMCIPPPEMLTADIVCYLCTTPDPFHLGQLQHVSSASSCSSSTSTCTLTNKVLSKHLCENGGGGVGNRWSICESVSGCTLKAMDKTKSKLEHHIDQVVVQSTSVCSGGTSPGCSTSRTKDATPPYSPTPLNRRAVPLLCARLNSSSTLNTDKQQTDSRNVDKTDGRRHMGGGGSSDRALRRGTTAPAASGSFWPFVCGGWAEGCKDGFDEQRMDEKKKRGGGGGDVGGYVRDMGSVEGGEEGRCGVKRRYSRKERQKREEVLALVQSITERDMTRESDEGTLLKKGGGEQDDEHTLLKKGGREQDDEHTLLKKGGREQDDEHTLLKKGGPRDVCGGRGDICVVRDSVIEVNEEVDVDSVGGMCKRYSMIGNVTQVGGWDKRMGLLEGCDRRGESHGGSGLGEKGDVGHDSRGGGSVVCVCSETVAKEEIIYQRITKPTDDRIAKDTHDRKTKATDDRKTKDTHDRKGKGTHDRKSKDKHDRQGRVVRGCRVWKTQLHGEVARGLDENIVLEGYEDVAFEGCSEFFTLSFPDNTISLLSGTYPPPPPAVPHSSSAIPVYPFPPSHHLCPPSLSSSPLSSHIPPLCSPRRVSPSAASSNPTSPPTSPHQRSVSTCSFNHISSPTPSLPSYSQTPQDSPPGSVKSNMLHTASITADLCAFLQPNPPSPSPPASPRTCSPPVVMSSECSSTVTVMAGDAGGMGGYPTSVSADLTVEGWGEDKGEEQTTTMESNELLFERDDGGGCMGGGDGREEGKEDGWRDRIDIDDLAIDKNTNVGESTTHYAAETMVCEDGVLESIVVVEEKKETNMNMTVDDVGDGGCRDEMIKLGLLMLGKWETLLSRSDPMEPMFKVFGISYFKRVLFDKLAIPLSVTLLGVDCLHVCVHLPVGNRQMVWSLDGCETIDNDPDCGKWIGIVRVVDIPLEGIGQCRALQQVRTHAKIGVVHETRAIVPDVEHGRVLLLNYTLFPKSNPSKTVNVLRVLKPIAS
eukprot:GHVQ01035397.1.p1 GENE.GHVQ01035397.1~~GHVQ01035397.1.p1  ORF type:complete len:1216 (-),score=347.08 GHVQ01035397.1:309-3722(-)